MRAGAVARDHAVFPSPSTGPSTERANMLEEQLNPRIQVGGEWKGKPERQEGAD